MDWAHGLRGRALVKQAPGPEFHPQYRLIMIITIIVIMMMIITSLEHMKSIENLQKDLDKNHMDITQLKNKIT
jgi:hypothetical protein